MAHTLELAGQRNYNKPQTLQLSSVLCTLASTFFADSQIRSVAPTMKVQHSHPSMDWGIKIVRKLEQVCKAYRLMFKELNEKKAVIITTFLQRKEKTPKNTETSLFGGGGTTVGGILLFAGVRGT